MELRPWPRRLAGLLKLTIAGGRLHNNYSRLHFGVAVFGSCVDKYVIMSMAFMLCRSPVTDYAKQVCVVCTSSTEYSLKLSNRKIEPVSHMINKSALNVTD